MPDIDLEDITLHYEVDGSGPPLLLLAGMLSDSATWAGLLPHLTEHFTVIRPDNRSTGRTQLNGAPVDCAAMGRDALALMDALGHARFHCAGHSLGGLLTLELASAHPDRIATGTVLASGRVRSMRTRNLFDTLLAIRRAPQGEALWLRALYPWIFGDAFFERPDSVQTALDAALAYPYAQTVDAMAAQIEAFRNFRPVARLENITAPMLILYAEQDIMVPPSTARASLEGLANARHIEVPGAGHSIVWDATERVAAELNGFLADNPL